MNFKLEQEFSKTDIIKQVDDLKSQVDAMRPLPPDVEGRVMQKLRLDWNYHSNAIEGNRLNYGETVAFLMEGITAKGKPLKDHLDIRGHNEAINFLLDIVKDSRPISEADIRNLHTMILVEPYQVKAQTAEGLPTSKQITLGEYKTSANHVKTATGETHYYATPEETPAKMHDLMAWYNEIEKQVDVHPLVMAALFHHKFVAIHPFDDGNGRLSRILMNLILMQKGYPPVVVKMDDRINYYSLLSRADNGDGWPFVEYIGENLFNSLNLYFKAAVGYEIDDDDDIDKEITLFKMQIEKRTTYKEKKSVETVINVLDKIISPLSIKLVEKADKFQDLFNRSEAYLGLVFKNGHNKSETFWGFNENMYTFLRGRYSQFTGLEIYFSFEDFKDKSITFNTIIKQTILFNTYGFNILNNKAEVIASKEYHESISDVESRKIIKSLVDDIKSQIDFNLKRPKLNAKSKL